MSSSVSAAHSAFPRSPNGAGGRGTNDASSRPANIDTLDISGLPNGFAHTLNNYISIISGYSEVCLDKFRHSDEKLAKYMREIHGAAQMAGDLTRELLIRQKKPSFSTVNNFPSGNESILVVEDEKAVRELLRSVLEDHGYRVTFASDGETA